MTNLPSLLWRNAWTESQIRDFLTASLMLYHCDTVPTIQLSQVCCLILLFLFMFTDCFQSWGTRSRTSWTPPESYLQALSS